jgi:hypothetical protein
LSTADEVLAVLKAENIIDFDKKLEVEALIGKVDQEFFTDLLTISNNVRLYIRSTIMLWKVWSRTLTVMMKNYESTLIWMKLKKKMMNKKTAM